MEAAPAGPDTCSARPGVIARGQDESDRMLRQDLHRGALQGGPAVRPGAHAAGVAAVPEDAREGSWLLGEDSSLRIHRWRDPGSR